MFPDAVLWVVGGSVGSTGGRGRLVDVDVVVLDEVHYLSDISRGTVWEETVSTSATCLGQALLRHTDENVF